MEWSQVLSKNVKCFFSIQGASNTDVIPTYVILEKYPYIKGTLQFINNIGLNDILDPPEFRVYKKNSKFDILHAEKSANIFAKKTKKVIFEPLRVV